MGKTARKTRNRKYRLFRRDGDRCIVCGCKLTYETASIHHIIQRSEGGSNRIENLCLKCEDCHKETHRDYLIATFTKGSLGSRLVVKRIGY